jgi:hypothetical protein
MDIPASDLQKNRRLIWICQISEIQIGTLFLKTRIKFSAKGQSDPRCAL